MSNTLATSTVTSRDPKGNHFMQKVEAVYNKAGLTDGPDGSAQCLNEDPLFVSELATLIEKRSQLDKRFEFMKAFEVTVPADFNHANCLDTFKAAHQNEENKEFYFYNDAITDKNFAKTPLLVPGKKYLVKAFQIKGTVTSDDQLVQLKRVKAHLVGAQGLTLVYEQKKNELPKGRYSVSFDEKDNLPFVVGYHRVPGVHAYSDGDFYFNLGSFEDDWNDDCVLLAFCDLPEQFSDAQ